LNVFIVNVINECHNNSKALKEKEQEKQIIVKVPMAKWHTEISDCDLSPQAYLH